MSFLFFEFIVSDRLCSYLARDLPTNTLNAIGIQMQSSRTLFAMRKDHANTKLSGLECLLLSAIPTLWLGMSPWTVRKRFVM